ncbi:MAG: OmpW family outer membrane protein [Cytophagales bacterium]|nr:OmpW family outer membrane protein [Cytophagales bacterium]
MKHTFKLLLLSLALSGSYAVQAQTADTWLVRGGMTNITPNVQSGNMSAPSLPNTQVAIASDTQLSGGVTYMYSNNLAIDVPLALPFKHDISGAGAIAGVGKLGDVKALPITVLAQWRFQEPTAQFRPYLSAGLTYVKFYGGTATSTLSALTGGTVSNPTTLSVASKFAPTLQLGGSYMINERWFVNASYSYTLLKTTTTLSTGQTLDATLNPSALSVDLGYKF